MWLPSPTKTNFGPGRTSLSSSRMRPDYLEFTKCAAPGKLRIPVIQNAEAFSASSKHEIISADCQNRIADRLAKNDEDNRLCREKSEHQVQILLLESE